jgi:hypothetical protein
MKILRSALIAAAVLVPGAAMAEPPSVLGPSGYIFTPDGFVTPAGCVAIGYHHTDGDPHVFIRPAAGGGIRAAVVTPDVNAYKLNVGIGNRLELGMTAINTGEFTVRTNAAGLVSTTGGTNFLANGKLSLLPPKSAFQVVGGVIDAFDEFQRTAYLYGSVNIGPYLRRLPLTQLLPKRVQAGAGWGTGMIDGVFVNAGIPLSPNLELMFEWLDNDLLGVYGPGRQMNIGGRIRIARLPGLAVDVGATNMDNSALRSPYFGASYTFCRRKHHKKMDGGDGDGGAAKPTAPKPGGAPKGSKVSSADYGPVGGAGLFRTPR